MGSLAVRCTALSSDEKASQSPEQRDQQQGLRQTHAIRGPSPPARDASRGGQVSETWGIRTVSTGIDFKSELFLHVAACEYMFQEAS